MTGVLPYLLKGAAATLLMAAACIVTAGVAGLVLGVLAAIGRRVTRSIIAAYVFVIRGTPLLIQIFVVFYGFPYVGLYPNHWIVVFVAVSAHIAAHVSEIVRGAIITLPRGQMEGGRALGMRRAQIAWYVLVPQALRYALAPCISLLPVTVKATSFGSIIGFSELTSAGHEMAAQTFEVLRIYGMTLAIYFVICYPLTYFTTKLERRLTRLAH